MQRVASALVGLLVLSLCLSVQSSKLSPSDVKPFHLLEPADFESFLEGSRFTLLLVCTSNDQKTDLCQQAIQSWQDFIRDGDVDSRTQFALIDLRGKDSSPEHFPENIRKYLPFPVFFGLFRNGQKVGIHRYESQYTPEHIAEWYAVVNEEGLPEPENQASLLDEVRGCVDRLTTLVFVDWESSQVSSKELRIHDVLRFDENLPAVTVRDAAMVKAIGIPESAESGTLWAFPCHPIKRNMEPVAIPVEEEMTDDELFAAIIKQGLPNMGRIHNYLQKRGDMLYELTLVVAMSEEEAEGKLGRVLSSLKNVQVMWDEPDKIKGGFQRAGSTGRVWPAAIAVQPPGRTTVFNEADVLDAKNLYAFLKQVREGTYPPFVRSEDPSTFSTSGEHPIMPVASVNFDEKVRKSSLPSIVIFFVQQDLSKGKSLAAFDVMKRLGSYFSHHGQTVQLLTFNVEFNAPPPEHDPNTLPELVMYIPSPDGEKKPVVEAYDGKFALRPVTQWADSLLGKPARRIKHDEL